ncbi:MAG: dTMP kinase [Betaproteobacteria bacterium]
MRGKFITLEGVDGAGKSTHLAWIASRLKELGKDVIVTREPGGTPIGESLRQLILTQPMALETEALLVFAARSEHLTKVILPALEEGRWVLSDRFTDATFAYQGGGRGLARERIGELEEWVQHGLQPDLTLFFDVPLEIAQARLLAQRSALDRFEQENLAFFGRVRAAYLDRASSYPLRFRQIDGTQSLAEVKQQLEDIISIYCL